MCTRRGGSYSGCEEVKGVYEQKQLGVKEDVLLPRPYGKSLMVIFVGVLLVLS